MRRQEHDVGRDAAGQEVLAVLHRVAGLAGRDDDERRRPVELARRSGLGGVGGLLQPFERQPGRARGIATGSSGGGWAPSGRGRAARRASRRRRVGAVGLVRPPAADGGVDVHHRAVASPSSAPGFSSDDRSPGSSPSAAARTARRTILAVRVLGSASTNRTSAGANAFPSTELIWPRTLGPQVVGRPRSPAAARSRPTRPRP